MEELQAQQAPVVTSPVKIYHLPSFSKAIKCDGDPCKVTFTFEWLNPEAVCSSNFVCPTLDGWICQDYGVLISHITEEGIAVKNKSVCETKQVHHGTIGVGQKAVVTLWYQAIHEPFNADCYFWCTKNGHLPENKAPVPKYILVRHALFKIFGFT